MTIQSRGAPRVPPFAQGYVRTSGWAELPHHAVLIDSQVQASASYRQWQPFGQVPSYKDDDVEMFESDAIAHRGQVRSADAERGGGSGSGG